MRRRVAVVAVAVASLAACSSGQAPDIPGLERAGTTGVTTADTPDTGGIASNYPPRCPEGGPNATTPKAGCLTDDGTLVRP
jgi:hypothetical protein